MTRRAAGPLTALLAVLFVVVAAAHAQPATAPTTPSTAPATAPAGGLRLSLPDGWTQAFTPSVADAPAVVTLTGPDAGGATLLVRLSLMPLNGRDPTDDQLRLLAHTHAQPYAPPAPTEPLALRPLAGDHAHGYTFTLADPNPRPGQLPGVTGGVARIGDVLAFVTANHAKDSPAVAVLLDVLARASAGPATAPPQSMSSPSAAEPPATRPVDPAAPTTQFADHGPSTRPAPFDGRILMTGRRLLAVSGEFPDFHETRRAPEASDRPVFIFGEIGKGVFVSMSVRPADGKAVRVVADNMISRYRHETVDAPRPAGVRGPQAGPIRSREVRVEGPQPIGDGVRFTLTSVSGLCRVFAVYVRDADCVVVQITRLRPSAADRVQIDRMLESVRVENVRP